MITVRHASVEIAVDAETLQAMVGGLAIALARVLTYQEISNEDLNLVRIAVDGSVLPTWSVRRNMVDDSQICETLLSREELDEHDFVKAREYILLLTSRDELFPGRIVQKVARYERQGRENIAYDCQWSGALTALLSTAVPST